MKSFLLPSLGFNAMHALLFIILMKKYANPDQPTNFLLR
jgi:hypothetical protein